MQFVKVLGLRGVLGFGAGFWIRGRLVGTAVWSESGILSLGFALLVPEFGIRFLFRGICSRIWY
jgi:hypothetical protein